MNELKSRKSFSINKYSNRLHTVIGFPMESGLPFFHSYNIPTLFYMGGEVQAAVQSCPDNEKNRLNNINFNINASFEVG